MNNLAATNVVLNQALTDLESELTDLVQSDRWKPIIQKSFGDGLFLATAQQIQQAWVEGDFSDLRISIATVDALGGANGAYVNGDRSIYISEALLQGNNPTLVKSVLLEEIGHYLDDRFNDGKDTHGDEGELFSKLAQGIAIDAAALTQLRSEDDRGTIRINGQLVTAELAAGDYVSGNLADLKAGIDGFFNKIKAQIQTTLVTDLSVVKSIPLVGAKIGDISNTVGKDALDFLQSVQDKIDEKFTQAAGSSELIKTGLAEALGSSGLGLLKDTNGDGATDAKDITLTETADNLQVNLTLETKPKAINGTIKTDFATGTTGLGLKGKVELETNFGATLNLGFGFNNTNGFYIDTKDQSELTVNLGMSLPKLEIEGELGPFKAQITDGVGGAGFIKTGLVVDLKADTFDRIYTNEFGDLTAAKNLKTKISGSAGLNLHAETDISSSLPSIGADLAINWADFTNQPSPTGKFSNVVIDVGTFLSAFNPILKTIQDINKPIEPVVDLLNTKLPILKQTILELSDKKDNLNPATQKTANNQFLKEFAKISELVSKSTGFGGKIVLIGAEGVVIPFAANPPLVPVAINPLAALAPTSPAITPLAEIPAAGQEALDRLAELGIEAKGFADLLDPKKNPDFLFPLITDPLATIPKLLTGATTDLISLRLPTLQTGFKYDGFITFFGPVGAQVNVGLGVALNVKFGYDSTGWNAYSQGGFSDASDIAKGLFIEAIKPTSDLYGVFPLGKDQIPKDNPRYDEFIVGVGGRAFVGLGVGFGPVSATFGGGLNASLKLVPANPLDNKIRIANLAAPGCILLPHGKVDAYLATKVQLGFGPFSFNYTKVLVKETLLDYTAECAGSRDDLGQAKKGNNGVLELQTTNNDDIFFVKHGVATTPGTVSVAGNEIVEVEGSGTKPLYSGIKSITNNNQTDGNDIIALDRGVLSPAVLRGGKGFDQIDGGAGSDQIFGDDGTDVLVGNGGNDSIYGGADDDMLTGGAGNDLLDGGAGNNFATYAADPKRIVALSTGGATAIVQDGYGGTDSLVNIQQLEGSNFGDYIALNGSNQNLVVFGLDGNDNIATGTGNDFLLGGEGADTMNGGAGEDATSYTDSWDNVNVNLATTYADGGTASGDRLFNMEDVQGSIFDDVLVGNSSANRLDGNIGADTIEGGAGADTLTAGQSDVRTRRDDLVTYKHSSNGVNVNITADASVRNTGGDAQGDVLFAAAVAYTDQNGIAQMSRADVFSNLEGSKFGDILTGNELDNTIYGLAGGDTINSSGGNDTLVGGAGADRFDGGTGSDWVDYSVSESGSTTFIADVDNNVFPTTGVTVDLTVDLPATGQGGDAQGDTFVKAVNANGILAATVENIRGSDFNDNLYGDAGDNIIAPGLGIDFVDGRGGEDALQVDYGIRDIGTGINALSNAPITPGSVITRWDNNGNILDQVTYQNIESLQLTGTIQNDKVAGTDGSDIIDVQDGDDLVYGYSGSDNITGGDGNDTLSGGNGIDNLTGGDGKDFLIGDAGNDDLKGGAGDDIVFGGSDAVGVGFFAPGGDDSLSGDEGRDLLIGGVGRDQIFGGDDKDLLIGGSEDDILSGDAGDDVLVGGDSLAARKLYYGQPIQNQLVPLAVIEFNPANYAYDSYPYAGADTMTGGAGADQFWLNFSEGGDGADRDYTTITDYTPTEGDKIVVPVDRTTIGDGGNYIPESRLGLTQYGGAGSPFFLKQVGADVQIFLATLDAPVNPVMPNNPPANPIIINSVSLADDSVTDPSAAIVPSAVTVIGGGVIDQNPIFIDPIIFIPLANAGVNQIALVQNTTLDKIVLTLPSQLAPAVTPASITPLAATVNSTEIPLSTSTVEPETLDNSTVPLVTSAPAFTIAQTSDATALLNKFLSPDALAVLKNVKVKVIGDSRAFGTFANDPFGLNDGLVLSTGRVKDLPGVNQKSGRYEDILFSNIDEFVDLNTDLGKASSTADKIALEIEFDSTETDKNLFFQYVFGSEELTEYGGTQFNDSFSLQLNGQSLAKLSDGKKVNVNNLASGADGAYHPDLIVNSAGTGPAKDITKLDGYTKPETFVGNIRNGRNKLVIKLQDVSDRLVDSAVFLKANSLSTILPTSDLPIGGADAVIVTPAQIEVTEGDLITNSFDIKLKGPISAPVTITVTPNAQVLIGNSFNPLTGDTIDPTASTPITLTFTPGNYATPQSIFVKAVDDAVIQGKRTVPITLTTSSADTRFDKLVITPEQVVINDNEKYTVGISASQDATEGSIDGSFTITLDAPAPTGGLTVLYSLAGVATTPADYSLTAGANISAVTANSFTIAAGQTTATIKAIALNDNLLEPNEDVQLQLQASPDYLIGTESKTLNIIDNPLRANVSPIGTDKTVAISEDSSYTFTAADFGFSDASDTPINNFTQVKITTLPTAGTLKLGANAVNIGDVITVANIPQLNFSPVANANGAGYAKLSFQVQDDGGTANGGVDLDPTPNAITFDVTPVNDLATISGISTGSVTKDTSVNVTNRSVSNKLTVSDLDPGEAKFKTIVTPVGATLGTVSIDPSGNYKYTVANSAIQGLLQGQTKVETFTVQSFDGSAAQNIEITINGVNDINPSSTSTAQIKGTVWNDLNASSNRDPIEPGLAGWQVYLDLNGNSQLDATDKVTLTKDDGTYQFSELAAGNYTVNEVLQTNWKQTFPVVGPLSTTAADIALFTPDIAVEGAVTTIGTTNPTELVQIDKLAQNPLFANTKGQGLTTVVIDTGIDVDHPLFGADKNGDGIADRIVYQYDFADNDTDASDKTGHGSHVSSIISSIAPESSIIALKVFKDDGTGSFANLENALQWVANNAKTYNVGAVNISLGDGGNWNTAESRYGLGDELAALANQNIITSAATGNSFFQDISVQGNAYPAADPNVIGVGAVWATGATTPQKFGGGAIDYTAALDRIASFSQRSSALNNVFAPGIFINGANATGGTTLLGGTSQSVAFVSSIATLAQQIAQEQLGRKLTVAEFRSLLATTSTPIQDGDDENTNVNASGLTLPRINALALAEGVLKLNSATLPNNSIPSNQNSPTTPALTAYATKQNITLTTGQIVSGVDFGNQIIPNRPPVLTGSIFTFPTGLEDNTYSFTAANLTAGYTDADGDLLNVTNLNVTNGTVVNNAGVYTFTPTVNYNGAVNLTYDLVDSKGGITPVANSLNLLPVSDAPAGTDKSINLLEETSYTLTAADFGFTDINDIPANTLTTIKISSLASVGTLKLNNVAVAANDVISVTDINASKLTFISAPNTTGAANFTFQVQDNGGITNGGIDLDSTPNTITFNVTSINDAPAGTDKSISLLEDNTYALTVLDFGFTDINDTPANALSAVKISSLVAAGSLKLNGVAVVTGDLVTVADITAGKLTFNPVANASGNNYANFTFQVQDNGGITNGGIDLDATPNTITFNVTSINDVPAGTDKSISCLEDSNYILTAADFGFTDTNDIPANALNAVKISSLVSAGSLKLNGTVVNVNDLISVADINGGKLTFTPVANANGNNYANFTFQVQDNGGITNGGVDLDATPNTITFNVTSINDVPAGTDKSISLLEDNTYALTPLDFGFTDLNDTPVNALSAVKISSLVAAGSLKLNGVAVVTGDLVTVADITAGKLTFTPVANANGDNYANFTFQVQDNGGITNGGVDLDATPNTITFNVTSINDVPAGTDKSISLLEDNTYALTVLDFGFTDINDTPANALSAVKISSLVATGSLKLNGVAVVTGDLVTVADITAGKLTFNPVTNASGSNYANFTFQVQDNGGIANGGIDLDATPNTITFNVISVNDAPMITIGVTDSSTGSVTEIADGALGENARNLNVNGTLTITDVELNDIPTVAAIPKGTPYAGTFTPVITDSTTGDGKGQITWSFSVPDKDIDSLAAGQVLTQTYTIIANDGQGGIANQDVTITLNGTNDAPTVIKPIKKETIGEGQALKFTIPADTFQDVDAGDKLTYSATLKDGKPLPTWLVLNPLTGEFSGTPTGTSAGEYKIKVIATDIAGTTANTILTLKVLDFIGGKGNDTLHGTDYAETLAGGDGDDTLIGKAGDDCLEGGKGNDHLTGGDGHDKLSGGAGNDKLFGEADDDHLDGGDGDDYLEGGKGHDKLIGGKGKDKLIGGDGHDYLEAGAGDDTLVGGKGDDTLLGNAGSDYLEGSEGDDTYVFDISTAQGKDKIEEAVKGGYDQIVFEGTGNVVIDLSITTAQNINANLVLTVINLEDVTGSSGNDTISGNSSNNILAGAAGNDTLKGGKGADAFVFGSSYLSFAAIGVDKIVDFAPMLDEIRLDKATFAHLGTLAGSHLLASDFEIVKQDSAVAASVAAIVYSSSSGKLFYNENGISDGLGLGGQFAELTKNLNLTSDEFMAIS